MRKKILICGATGFIGRHFVEFFMNKDEFEVYGTYRSSKPLDDPRIKMVKADLTNNDDVERVVNEGFDIIIQAAATTSGAKDTFTRPYYHVTDNAVMNSFIFRSAHKNNVSHVVFFSCTTMYQSSEVPVKETDFNESQEFYPKYFGVAWTKVYIEKMCEFYAKIGNTKYTAIRHSNVFGPYDKFGLENSHVFGATMTKVMTAKDGEKVVVWGAGEEERDLIYISDLVDFVNRVITKQENKFRLYNVGCRSSISVNDMVQKIIDHSGKNIEIEHDLSKPSIETKLCLDITKANKELGWSPKITLTKAYKKQWNGIKLMSKVKYN